MTKAAEWSEIIHAWRCGSILIHIICASQFARENLFERKWSGQIWSVQILGRRLISCTTRFFDRYPGTNPREYSWPIPCFLDGALSRRKVPRLATKWRILDLSGCTTFYPEYQMPHHLGTLADPYGNILPIGLLCLMIFSLPEGDRPMVLSSSGWDPSVHFRYLSETKFNQKGATYYPGPRTRIWETIHNLSANRDVFSPDYSLSRWKELVEQHKWIGIEIKDLGLLWEQPEQQ